MSFDLTNKNIQDTFQNLLQRTGSDNRLYDLEGNQITDLRINGNLTADQYIVSSSVTNITTQQLSGSTQFGDSSDDTHQFTGSMTVNGEISSSKLLIDAPNPTDDFFLLKSGSLDSLKVNNQGVLVLGGFTYTPTAVRGGLYYDQDDDEFYAGKNN